MKVTLSPIFIAGSQMKISIMRPLMLLYLVFSVGFYGLMALGDYKVTPER